MNINILEQIKIIIRLIFIIILFNGCTKNKSITQIEKGIFKSIEKPIPTKSIRLYPGDTLKTISKKFKITVKELVLYNNIKAPFILKPGTYIKIPDPQRYKIKKNDTLFKIAKCYKLNLEEIKVRNKNLNEKKLIVGSNINLPYYSKSNFCSTVKKKKVKKNLKAVNKNRNLFSWPTDGKVIATYGLKKGGRKNDGINIRAAKGNPVRAALKGKVIYKGNELPAWGNLVLIKHNNNWTSAYAHLSKTFVKVGDTVKTGHIIGAVGRTGNADTFQLHFQIRKKSKPLDPMKYLKAK